MSRSRWFLLLLSTTGCAAPPPAKHAADDRLPSTGSAVSASAVSQTSAPPRALESETEVAIAASAPWPGVACDDVAAAANLRFFACTAACERGEAAGCELLGELHAAEEGQSVPASSAGPAARAWRRGCSLGASTACTKETELLTLLERNCQANAADCVTRGNALLELDTDRNQVEALFQRACRKGHALGCYASGDLHAEWEPREQHEVLSLKAYLRACQLGSAEGCCTVLSHFEALGNQRAAAQVRRDMSKIAGAGCGSGGPVRPQLPQPLIELTVEQVTGALAPEALDVHQTLYRRLFRYCVASTTRETPSAAYTRVLRVDIDPQGKVTQVTALPNAARPSVAPKSAAETELEKCWTTRVGTLQFEPSQGACTLNVALSTRPRDP